MLRRELQDLPGVYALGKVHSRSGPSVRHQRRGWPLESGTPALPVTPLPPGASGCQASEPWWRTISVPPWGRLVLPTAGVGWPLWKETQPQTPARSSVFPAGG